MRIAAVPIRRSLSDPWFSPILKIIDKDGSSRTRALDMRQAHAEGPIYIADFTAGKTGEAYLFVNDAVLLVPGRQDLRTEFYRNNTGTATVEIEPLETLKARLKKNQPAVQAELP